MELELAPCTNTYWEFVRELRNDERVQSGFIDDTFITEEMQTEYMKKYCGWYRIALVDGEPAGYVGSIDKDIRVCTHPDHQGKGIGSFMINTVMEYWIDSYAKVKLDNEASLNLFLSCGFTEDRRDDEFIYLTKK